MMYSIQALWTAVRESLPLTVIVLNNGGYGAMRSFSRILGVEVRPASTSSASTSRASPPAWAARPAKSLSRAISPPLSTWLSPRPPRC